MIKHHIKRVVLFSNNQHNLYIGHPWISSFHFRSMFMLGYRVGWMELLGHFKSAYHPYDKVFTIGKDPKDP
ncbi:MAG: hypothetical protein HRT44_11630, partial [Bdellovibrionales bacterium]|nr:hypothetical protein [Bdellovibrionales bacterium]NQZ19892.1 hypothetical protein [Bdellovibrionales bacterium]